MTELKVKFDFDYLQSPDSWLRRHMWANLEYFHFLPLWEGKIKLRLHLAWVLPIDSPMMGRVIGLFSLSSKSLGHICPEAAFTSKGTFLPSHENTVAFILNGFMNKIIFMFLSGYLLSSWYQHSMFTLTMWF